MKKYEFFDVTADVGVKAFGKTLEEAFQNTALAMFEVMTDTKKIEPTIKKEVHLKSEDTCALLYDWLDELIFLHDAEFLIFNQFKLEITKIGNDYDLKATVWGEVFDQDRHESREDIKAVTYHLMEVKEEEGFKVKVILDT